MSELIAHVTDDSFESDVLKSNEPVLVDYWAEWCGPCKMIAPVLDEIASEYNGKITTLKHASCAMIEMTKDLYLGFAFDKPLEFGKGLGHGLPMGVAEKYQLGQRLIPGHPCLRAPYQGPSTFPESLLLSHRHLCRPA